MVSLCVRLPASGGALDQDSADVCLKQGVVQEAGRDQHRQVAAPFSQKQRDRTSPTSPPLILRFS